MTAAKSVALGGKNSLTVTVDGHGTPPTVNECAFA
jgi:hypothetical protein